MHTQAHLGIPYVHAIFGANTGYDNFGPSGDVFSTNGTVVTASCAENYSQIGTAQSTPIQAICNLKTLMWELTNASVVPDDQGCYPTDGICNPEDELQLAILNVNMSLLPTTSGASATTACSTSAYKYNPLGHCASDGAGCLLSNDVTIMCGAHGLYEWKSVTVNGSTSTPFCSAVFYNPNEYCKAFNNAISKANKMVSIPYLISAVISPFLGIFVDRCVVAFGCFSLLV
jgi:hypothetical protein